MRIELGSGLTTDHNHSRPAEVLTEGWGRGKPEALDITVTSSLYQAIPGGWWGVAALAAVTHKHTANDNKCP